MKKRVPQASNLSFHIDEHGNIHLRLYNERRRSIASVCLNLEGAIRVIDDIDQLIDDYIEKHPEEFGDVDTIGECMGEA